MKLHKEFKKYIDNPESDFYSVDEAVYEKYEDKEVVDYCDSCGNEDGSHIEKVGINLLGYKRRRFKKDSYYYMAKYTSKTIAENILEAPSIFSRLKKTKK